MKRIVIACLGLLVFALADAAPRNAEAEAFLVSAQRADGSIAGVSDIGTAFQATSESIPFVSANLSVRDEAVNFLYSSSIADLPTEYLARALAVAPAVAPGATAELLSRRQADGGFSAYSGLPSNVLDTAYAVQSGVLAPEMISGAVQYLSAGQLADGSWAGPDGQSSVFVSSQALAALWANRLMPGITAEASAARDYLIAAGALGGWDGLHETALAVAILAPMLPDGSVLGSHVVALEQAQLANGSWDDDAYVTALALRALNAVAVGFVDRTQVTGRIIDSDSGIGIAGATVSIVGPETVATATSSDGSFTFSVNSPGNYQLSVDATGYPELSTQLAFGTGASIDLGAIQLLRVNDMVTATIQGTVYDNETGAPLGGVSISAGGGVSTVTSADGTYLLGGLAAGTFSVTATRSGYESASVTGSVAAGGTVQFSPRLRLGFASTFRLNGQVTESTTGAPVSGAVVSIAGQTGATTVTDSNGFYELTELQPGQVTVLVTHEDFHSASRNLDAVANQQANYSPVMLPVSGPSALNLTGTVADFYSGNPMESVVVTITHSGGITVVSTDTAGQFSVAVTESDTVSVNFSAPEYLPRNVVLETVGVATFDLDVTLQTDIPAQSRIVGRLVDADTGVPIEGASAAVTHAGGAAEDTTDSDGAFELNPVPVGVVTLEFGAPGYLASVIQIEITVGGLIQLGDWALQVDAPPEPVTVTGIVVNSQSGAPIAGAQLSGPDVAPVMTDVDGRFTIPAVSGMFIEFDVSASGFDSVNYSVLVDEENPDVGEIRLRPEGLDSALPDLTVHAVGRPTAPPDTDSFHVSGSIEVSLVVAGGSLEAQSVNVTAFHDADGNGVYQDGVDLHLGGIAVDGSAFGVEAVVRQIAVDGTLPFRDAPISVFVDSDRVVVERDEGNNVGSTALMCRRTPGTAVGLQARTKWHWRGSEAAPNSFTVYGPVMVAQLTDDNEDSVIDERDIPDLVFIASGRLTVVSGDDGRTHWQLQGAFPTGGSVAVGDLTGDGIADIVVPHSQRERLYAFRHDGTLLWDVPTGLTNSSSLTVRDGVAIADLNGDGSPEVVHGNRAYRADGSRLWTGNAGRGGPLNYGLHSLVADINLDGGQEVIAGRTVYRANGSVMWSTTTAWDGFNAVGDLDNDGYPEVIMISQGRLRVMNHDGTIRISSVSIPGAGTGGGAPTVADFDGDGLADIGVAGQSRYVVFNGDGSVKWQQVVRDPSGRTGSSVFDFDGDGRMEVVYADEDFLYIFDGTTGAIRLQMQNESDTTMEYPVIADVDNSGSANIVLGSAVEPTRGLRVLEADGAGWMPTRSIWNQHTYHITNINDDGTIPAHETPSWVAHNTYRANAFLDRDPLDAADLTIGRLRIVDNGTGQPLTLRARVGNAGVVSSTDGILVSFFDGADSSAPLLGTVALPPIAPGAWRDIELTGITGISGTFGVTAAIDVAGGSFDCVPDNNEVSQSDLPTVGAIGIQTDASQYAPQQSVAVLATVQNTGTFTRDYSVRLFVEDASGNQVAALSEQVVAGLPVGGQVSVSDSWYTGLRVAGAYRVRAVLVDGDGGSLASDLADFAIAHDPAGGPLATVRLTTDRTQYHTTDTVLFDVLARNLSASTQLAASSIRLTITDPTGVVIKDELIAVHAVSPGGHASIAVTHDLDSALVGEYQTTVAWLDAGGGVLAESDRTFWVDEDPLQALRGNVTVSSPQVFRGDTQICTGRITNTGTLAAVVTRRQVVMRLDDEDGTPEETSAAVDVAIGAGDSDTRVHSVGTTSLTEGIYACFVEVEIDDEWHALAYASFRVLVPPIQIDANLGVGLRGRLLVLLDPACQDQQPPQAHGDNCDADPFGPDDAPPMPVQRDLLESELEAAGWEATVVTDAVAFEQAFASRSYEVYALFAETVHLPEILQRAVVEDIASGRGLLVAGNHDRRNGRVEDALGIRSLGKNLDVTTLVISPFGQYAGGELELFVAEAPSAVRLEGAVPIGHFQTLPSGNQAPASEPTLTRHDHGHGTGIYAGFDLLSQSAMEGNGGAFAGLLIESLAAAHPDPYVPVAGRVFPLALTLENAGVAVSGQVQLLLPDGVTVVDGSGGEQWSFALAEDQQLSQLFWLRLPESSGWITVEAVVYVSDGTELVEHTRTQIVLNVQAQE